MRKLLLILLCLSCGSAAGYDPGGGRRFAMSDAVVISSPSATGYSACPISVMENNKLMIESGYLRRYDLSDLDQLYFAVAGNYGKIKMSLWGSQFGKSEYYTEKIIRGSIGFDYGHFSVAIIPGGKLVEFGNLEGSFNAVSIGFAFGGRWRKYHLALVADNINKPKISESSEPDNRKFELYGEIEGTEVYSVVGRLAWEDNKKMRATIGQLIRFIDNNSIMWGVSSHPLTYSGGVEINYDRFFITYAASNHPALGLSHNIAFGIKKI